MAAACGDVEEVERRLAHDPQAAKRTGGPRNCTALAYLAYGRIDDTNGLIIARRLREAGADPNAQFNDGWDSPFKVLTGAIRLGEGVKPSHPQAAELAELLIGAGAKSYDSQALYNVSIVGSDTFWYGRLWDYCETAGVLDYWRDPAKGGLAKSKGLNTIDYLLGNAVSQNHRERAEWLLRGARTRTAALSTPAARCTRRRGFPAMSRWPLCWSGMAPGRPAWRACTPSRPPAWRATGARPRLCWPPIRR